MLMNSHTVHSLLILVASFAKFLKRYLKCSGVTPLYSISTSVVYSVFSSLTLHLTFFPIPCYTTSTNSRCWYICSKLLFSRSFSFSLSFRSFGFYLELDSTWLAWLERNDSSISFKSSRSQSPSEKWSGKFLSFSGGESIFLNLAGVFSVCRLSPMGCSGGDILVFDLLLTPDGALMRLSMRFWSYSGTGS